ncbi:MAG: ATP-dependent DNA helicase [Opitutales bacterium]
MIRIVDEMGAEQGASVAGVMDEVSGAFAQGGLLQANLDLEYRPQQEAMALAVCRSMLKDESLLFEAGTGVGKGMAYLLPGILFAKKTNRPFVVATHTISLQEQILKKDLPLCRALFEKSPQLLEYRDFQATLLAGKANYLCTTRLSEAIKSKGQEELFETTDRMELHRIMRWASEGAREGMRQELSPRPNPEVWDKVNADSSICSRKRCDPEKCFYQRARERISDADLIVVNHSLLFALLGAGMGPRVDSKGILFAEDFLVLDEAHQVPKVAADHFGSTLGSFAVALTLRRLYDSRKKKGLLAKWGERGDRALVKNAHEAADSLFYHVRENLVQGSRARRVLTPNALPSDFLVPVINLIQRLREVGAELADSHGSLEIKDQAERLENIVSVFREFQELEDPQNVYWAEQYGNGGLYLQLRIAPINPAAQLREALFSRGVSAILTSATLRQGGDMDRFCSSVGAEETVAEAEDSPFDFDNNVVVFVARDCPEPSQQEDRSPYLYQLAELVFRCAQEEPGGTLALFTNFADLRQVAELVEPRWRKEGRKLFVHGKKFSRSELRRQFAAAGNGLLLGTDSFWMGIDVPGAALSQVIVTRLPFENPNHPVAEAKAERMREEGLNAFAELTLPDALLRFRQGIGRLIRKKDDRGLITVLDSRILRKSYGRNFLSALPKKEYHTFALSSFAKDFAFLRKSFGSNS